MENTEKPKKNYGIKHAIFVIFLLVVIFEFVSYLFYKKNDNNATPQTQQTSSQKQNETLDEIDAYIQGQYYVKQILKSPATAKFPPIAIMVHHLKDSNRYEVVSYVDSQNSFGALLRSSWNVLFSYQDGKTNLERIVVDGKVVYPIQGTSKETKQEIEKTQKLLDDLQKEIKSYE